ncbi:MAG: type II toxin-antitoxin system RelE/ParE family toxin [Methylocystis sp.]
MQAKRAGLTEAELFHIAAVIAADPQAGDLIQGSGGARKLRFARLGEGKSGGYRTIHYFAGEEIPVFLLALIDKRERANLSKAELNQLAAILNQIAASYRGDKR